MAHGMLDNATICSPSLHLNQKNTNERCLAFCSTSDVWQNEMELQLIQVNEIKSTLGQGSITTLTPNNDLTSIERSASMADSMMESATCSPSSVT